MRATSATPSESFAPVDMEPHAARSAMLANGYVPIPLDGKKPVSMTPFSPRAGTSVVDELIPSAGLVLVWGKQKTFKSFWLLDLFVHVAMGWSYRDHAVRQGGVIYCAFEGGHHGLQLIIAVAFLTLLAAGLIFCCSICFIPLR